MREAEDLSLLEAAAREAGEVALRYWRKSPKSWDKGEGAGPVSEADLAVNAALEAHLRGARPDYGWLSEESPDGPERLAAERLFILDPIDGTRAFLEGEENFALSLAVVAGGRPVAGVVYLPARRQLYTASAGGPALRNGREIACGTRAALEGADVLTTRAALAPEHWPRGVPALKRSFRSSLAYRLCLAAEGRHDAMLTLRPAWEWDIAAGTLIAERAGCAVTDPQGRALALNAEVPRATGVVAANPALHGALLAALGHGG
ncbi:3'(2'),5'-bisphosphate nucleotidase CysQ [Rhodobacter sp. SGA-6-6]|uniref:3'(2'),5'-bisphosphate nucleotidase CysQ n=1 Tax=Rhodobacter sp. SGA-6-6 TaxID=2710882 RepID=UPI0013EAFE88|nr:3'(2'),5'-bisphosphate nucleotidase CysQ [Rhodobacter sp. SGA-6-6]NGM44232.1 3'(2'),5'-bisphosphate nucleotidase CysQ [Rhodobacter sp. SGA-6-6]